MKSFQAIMMAALIAASALAQSEPTTTTGGIYDANKNIGSWINPNALTGILLMIMFFWLCQWTLSMLAAIQTPTVMLEKTIDWGKVEKTEE